MAAGRVAPAALALLAAVLLSLAFPVGGAAGVALLLAGSAALVASALLVLGEDAARHLIYLGVVVDAFTTGAGTATGMPEAGPLARLFLGPMLPVYFTLEAAIYIAVSVVLEGAFSRHPGLAGRARRLSVAIPATLLWAAALGNYTLLLRAGVLGG
ncbi:MAG: hypothetical protein LRS49_03680 [Desulfurococcales archaeon]|nr:hypothetical protein [Desulfurococcales archaeon]